MQLNQSLKLAQVKGASSFNLHSFWDYFSKPTSAEMKNFLVY